MVKNPEESGLPPLRMVYDSVILVVEIHLPKDFSTAESQETDQRESDSVFWYRLTFTPLPQTLLKKEIGVYPHCSP